MGSALLFGALGSACAQRIYTCVDAKGHRITADRPIADCMDRPQKELNSSGTVRRTIRPAPTADELEAAEREARTEQEARQHEEEERRRLRALAARFPDRAAHDKERALALQHLDDVLATANKRSADLEAQQKRLAAEAGFYKSDPSKMPPALKRLVDENQLQIAAHKRQFGDQLEQKRRINARFDEELAQLQKLWGQHGGAAAPAPSVASAASATKKR